VYHVFYIFRVSRRNSARFVEISRAAGAVYRSHGAIDSEVMRMTETAGKYGCLSLGQIIAAGPDEEMFIGHDSFRNVEEFGRVTTAIDADPQIGELYQAIQQVVDLAGVVRWEADGAG
jgi:hypothetical protein